MVQPEVIAAEHAQRVAVHLENNILGRNAKIRVENFDEKLGWYSSGALTIPLHQLSLLEQAIAEMRKLPVQPEYATIIPFPGCAQAA